MKSICFVGGKSGGHIIPCLTLARQHKNAHILFFSTDASLDKSLLHKNPHITKHITLPLGALRSNRIYHYPVILWHITTSFWKSIYHLHKNKPKKIVCTGGLVSIPVCFAAKLLRIPIELYELNATPGKATQLIALFTPMIHICFTTAAHYFPGKKCIMRSYPVKFTKPEQQINKKDACNTLGLDPDKKTVFILGGSQGAIFLNTLIKDFIKHNDATGLQIIHQTGMYDQRNWQHFYLTHSIGAHVFSYTNNIAQCYAAADLIISRAGAGTLFETYFFNKQSIVIPLEIKQTRHQYDNAHAMMKDHPTLFTVIQQNEIQQNKTYFFNKIKHILHI